MWDWVSAGVYSGEWALSVSADVELPSRAHAHIGRGWYPLCACLCVGWSTHSSSAISDARSRKGRGARDLLDASLRRFRGLWRVPVRQSERTKMQSHLMSGLFSRVRLYQGSTPLSPGTRTHLPSLQTRIWIHSHCESDPRAHHRLLRQARRWGTRPETV
jgi:hypothetical protein